VPDRIALKRLLNILVGIVAAIEPMQDIGAFAKLGAGPDGGPPSEFGQIAQWGQVVKESGIKMPQ